MARRELDWRAVVVRWRMKRSAEGNALWAANGVWWEGDSC